MRGAAMTELPAQLVIRRAAPLRRVLLACAGLVIAVIALYLAYERGRYDGGYDRVAAAEQRETLRTSIAQLERTNRDLRARIAELDTFRVGRAQERSELARTIGELQAQVARQTQEISFYRSVLSEGAVARSGAEGALELRQVRITPGTAAGRYEVHLTLLQTTRPEAETKGTVRLAVAGSQLGKPVTLDESVLTGGKARDQAFSFRYFETLDTEITLPAGFVPAQLTVEAQATGHKPATPLSQTFPWHVEAP
jgi:hypothetical protein